MAGAPECLAMETAANIEARSARHLLYLRPSWDEGIPVKGATFILRPG